MEIKSIENENYKIVPTKVTYELVEMAGDNYKTSTGLIIIHNLGDNTLNLARRGDVLVEPQALSVFAKFANYLKKLKT